MPLAPSGKSLVPMLQLLLMTQESGMIYHIRRNIDSDFNLAIRRLRKDHQINLCHYLSIYTTSMDFSTYSTQNRQFKIPSRFEQTAKYNVRQ